MLVSSSDIPVDVMFSSFSKRKEKTKNIENKKLIGIEILIIPMKNKLKKIIVYVDFVELPGPSGSNEFLALFVGKVRLCARAFETSFVCHKGRASLRV